MKFTVSQSSLTQAIGVVMKGVASASTLPILSGVLVKAQDGILEFQTSNYTISILVQLMILSQHKCRNSSISSVWQFPKMSKSEVLRFPPESVCAQPVITLKTVTRKRIKLYIMSNRTVKISSSSISRLTVKNFLPPVLAKIFSS